MGVKDIQEMLHFIGMETNIEMAKRVGVMTNDQGQFGLLFMRTFTSPDVPYASEEGYLIVPVEGRALGELFIALRREVEQSPEKFGFTKHV